MTKPSGFLPLAILIFCAALSACGPAAQAPEIPAQQAVLPSATGTEVPFPTSTPPAASTPTLGDPTMTPTPRTYPYQIGAYFTEWGAGKGYYVKSIVDAGSADKITLIDYAFGIPGPDPDTGDVVCLIDNPRHAYGQTYSAGMSVDGAADDPNQPLRGHFNQIKKLKAAYPQIKVVVSLGGWTGSTWFSDAARTPESREKFVAACIDRYILGNLPEQNGAGGPGAAAGVFDGIDIDWEYPVSGGVEAMHHDPHDGENFVLLLEEFRKQYHALGRDDLLLTMAAPGPGSILKHYAMDRAHPFLDLIGIMTYDFRGAWSKLTGHHTNLCGSSMDPAAESERLSADASVRLFRDVYNVPPEKLLVGSAFYGKGWQNVGPENNGLFQAGEGMTEGSGGFAALEAMTTQGYARYWDASAKAPWLYNPETRMFWTYDDPESLQNKSAYVRANGLGGVFFWEISDDDPQGSLVNAIDSALRDPSTPENPCP